MPFLFIWALFGFWAMAVASNRGKSGCLWLFLGVLLGPIGVVAAYTVGGSVCPACRSDVHPEATKCPKCQTDLEPLRKK